LDKRRVNIIVSGIVQMVGFRYYTVNQASQLSITGWVRNNRDGSLEIVAEGEKENLEELIRWCHKGPSSAAVERVEKYWSDFKGDFNDFSVTV
jgi:acylphosphatase